MDGRNILSFVQSPAQWRADGRVLRSLLIMRSAELAEATRQFSAPAAAALAHTNDSLGQQLLPLDWSRAPTQSPAGIPASSARVSLANGRRAPSRTRATLDANKRTRHPLHSPRDPTANSAGRMRLFTTHSGRQHSAASSPMRSDSGRRSQCCPGTATAAAAATTDSKSMRHSARGARVRHQLDTRPDS